MIARVLFVSQRRAEAMRGRQSAAIISITDPGRSPARLDRNWAAVLRLAFHDADPVTFPGANAELMPMSAVQGRLVVEFTVALPATVRSVVVHCRSGISRSAGVAKAIADLRGLAFDPGYREFNRHVHAVIRQAC